MVRASLTKCWDRPAPAATARHGSQLAPRASGTSDHFNDPSRFRSPRPHSRTCDPARAKWRTLVNGPVVAVALLGALMAAPMPKYKVTVGADKHVDFRTLRSYMWTA